MVMETKEHKLETKKPVIKALAVTPLTPAEESVSTTTPESEKALPVAADTLQRLLMKRLAEILRQHSAMESSIALDHEYWQLKEMYTANDGVIFL